MRKEEYSTKVRQALERKVLNVAQKGEVFVFFKHEEPRKALSKRKSCCKQSILDAGEPV